MKTANVFAVTSLLISLAGCGNKHPEQFFAIDESKLKSVYHTGDTAELNILNPEEKTIDSTVFFANEQKITSVKGEAKATFVLTNKPLGYQNLKARVYYDGNSEPTVVEGRIEIGSSVQPKLWTYKVLNTYPHDTAAFTEGLEFYRDTLLESTGQKGASWLRKLDYKTGKVYQQHNLEPHYFGEGITVVGNKIFQLTWQEKTGFIYNADTWKLETTFTYDKDIEGWGMTNDGTHIYHSDGTEKIWKMDPGTQKMLGFVNVYSGDKKIKSVNELEYANGKIYGNVWQKDAVAVVDPATGSIEAIIDFADLRKELKNPKADVLNGIAYHKKSGTFFITGKNWDKMFQVKLQ